MKAFLLVFAGGGLGSVFRYLVYRLLSNGTFPDHIGTLFVNITGSLILGFILGYSLKGGISNQNTLLFLTTGFCGGFTTFSTFAFENLALLRSGDYLNFSLYVFGSLFAGLLAVFAGLLLSKLL